MAFRFASRAGGDSHCASRRGSTDAGIRWERVFPGDHGDSGALARPLGVEDWLVVVHDLPSLANADTDFEFCEIQSSFIFNGLKMVARPCAPEPGLRMAFCRRALARGRPRFAILGERGHGLCIARNPKSFIFNDLKMLARPCARDPVPTDAFCRRALANVSGVGLGSG